MSHVASWRVGRHHSFDGWTVACDAHSSATSVTVHTPQEGACYMNMSLRRSKLSRHRPAPSTTVSSGRSTSCAAHRRLLLDPQVEAPQHRAATDEVDALGEEVLRELGRRAGERLLHRAEDRLDRLVDRLAHLFGREHDGLGHAAHEVAAAHLGLVLVVGREHRADGELHLLGGALTDGEAVLAAHVALDGGVDVERADPDRFERDDTAEGDDRDLAGATADVDDHVAERLVDRERRADGGRHGLLDEEGLRRARTARRLEHRALLDVGDGRRHADQHPGALQPRDARALEQHADEALRDLEVGDGAAAQRTDRDDVPGRAADHLPGVVHRARAPRGCGCSCAMTVGSLRMIPWPRA